jgi:uncharacterized protein
MGYETAFLIDDVRARQAMIQLADGSMFAPLAPNPEGMSPEAIACGLANACRFGGQTRRYYSVAQHSVLVAALAPNGIDVQEYALLHDAEEAFGLPDLPTPMKPFFPQFVEAQGRIGRMVLDRYGVDHRLKKLVKPFDTLALAIEKRDLKETSDGYLHDLPVPPDHVRIRPLSPRPAERLFLAAMARVFRERLPVDWTWLSAQPGFELRGAF